MRSFAGLLTFLAVAVVRVAGVSVRDAGPMLARSDPSCPVGQYYDNNSCRACQAGYACAGGREKAEKCQKGTFSTTGASRCTSCPPGTYSDQDFATSCKPVQCGWMPDGAGNGRGATGQKQCGSGSYSAAGSTSCTKCPAGSYCNSETTCQPTQCQPGRYAPNQGASDCLECPAGTFVNNYGSTSCCKCCAGSFNSVTSQTHCQACPEMTGSDGQSKVLVTSDIGSTSTQQCRAYKAGDPAPAPSSCVDSSQTLNQPTCPATTGPQPSGYSKKKRSLPRGCSLRLHTRCEIKTGRGGWECIDTNTTLDACGSCDNDCSAIPYVGDVKCIRGRCQVSSCQKGFSVQIVEDHPTCVPTSKHAYMIFEQDRRLMDQS